jgi:xylan 1,4-beta-xylosidase
MNQPIYQLKNFPSSNGYHIRRYTDTKHALHFHDCIEITILEKGEGIHVINGTEYYYPMYTFTIMDYRDCHAFFNLTPKNSLYNLMVSPSLISPAQLQKINQLTQDKICYLDREAGKVIISHLDTLYYLKKRNQGVSSTLIKNVCDNLVELFLTFFNQETVNEQTQKSEIQKSLEYINLHFKEKITLNNVAEYTGYNPSHFSKLFHQKMGITFNHYVSSIRLNYAKRLLATTNQSISFICFECGFASVSSFNRNFLEIVGCTPNAYRTEFKSTPPNTP